MSIFRNLYFLKMAIAFSRSLVPSAPIITDFFSQAGSMSGMAYSIDPEIRADISEKLKPFILKLEASLIIGDVKDLADRLISLGQHYQWKFLVADGIDLLKGAECYDIVKIKAKLKQIERFIDEDNLNGK